MNTHEQQRRQQRRQRQRQWQQQQACGTSVMLVILVSVLLFTVVPNSNAFVAVRLLSPLHAGYGRSTTSSGEFGAGNKRFNINVVTMAVAPAEVVVVGSCNTDLVAYTARLPNRGETVTGSRSETLHGGKGANQAVMASRMGAKVAMMACLGQDSFGDSYLENLESNGIDCTSVRRTAEAATGVAQLCVEESGANFIVVVPGANYYLSPEDVTASSEKLKGAKVMVCQGEMLAETTLAALELGRAAGMVTLFNPAPAVKDLPNRFLEASDVVVPNETELALMCQSTDVDPEQEESVCEGARELIQRGAKAVVVTLGSRGCMLVSSLTPTPGQKSFTMFPAEEVVATDTVGAGDAFMGSLAACLAKGHTLEDAIPKAVRVASMSVTRAGAQPSYPRSSELPPDLKLTA